MSTRVIPRPTARSARAFALAAAATLAPALAPARAAQGNARADRPTCNPAWCAVTRPTFAESTAIAGEADRLVARYAADSTILGRRCHALGVTMQRHATAVRMIDYMWRETDPDGQVVPVTGDAHPVELVAGSGTVHIARGYNALNPDRGLPAILQTARHEFAHLNGLRQSEGGVDLAAQLASACGPG